MKKSSQMLQTKIIMIKLVGAISLQSLSLQSSYFWMIILKTALLIFNDETEKIKGMIRFNEFSVKMINDLYTFMKNIVNLFKH
jgi:hypothetical protein